MSSLLILLILLPLLLPPTNATNTTNTTLCPAVRSCLSTLTTDQICANLLPVPASSFLPPQVAPFTLTTPRRGVYIYNDGFYLSLMLHLNTRLILLDLVDNDASNTPVGSMTRTTDAALQILNGTIPTRIDVVYSHAHFDHIGATTRFLNFMTRRFPNARVLIWGTAESRRLIRDSTTNRALPPTVTVGRRGRTLILDPQLRVNMRIVGGHSQQDMLLHIPPSRDGPGVTMMVDIVFPRFAPPFNFAITQDFRGYIRAHQRILATDFAVYVGGHIRIGDREDVRTSLSYAQDVLEAAKVAFRTVGGPQLAAGGAADQFTPGNVAFGNAWFVFIRVLRRLQIDECYRIVVSKWGCRIGAVDITARGHCFTALQFLLVDF